VGCKAVYVKDLCTVTKALLPVQVGPNEDFGFLWVGQQERPGARCVYAGAFPHYSASQLRTGQPAMNYDIELKDLTERPRYSTDYGRRGR
jgi:hypothetical protein